MRKPAQFVPNIQILRGVAALLVVLAHLAGEFDDHGFAGLLPDMTIGVFGVDLFFVISGFVMVHANATTFGTASSGAFLRRRAIRIIPLYWLFTAIFAFIALRQMRHTGPSVADILHIGASFVFLPSAEPASGELYPTYPLGWTLNYEMFFYLCMAAALPLRRNRAVGLLSAAFLAFVVTGAAFPLPMPLSWWARSQILEFVFGMLIALAMLKDFRLSRTSGGLLVFASILMVPLFVPHIDDWDVLRGLAWGIPAAGIVAGFSLTPSDRRGWVRRALETLGDASYSLYLGHYAVFVAIALILDGPLARKTISAGLYGFILLGGSLASAFGLYYAIERPMTRWLLRRAGMARQPLSGR